MNAPYLDVSGHVAVVTGGAHGAGAAVCRRLATNGATVVVNDLDQAAIDAVVGDIRKNGGTAIGIRADCTNSVAVERMRQLVEQDVGAVEVLVALAGSASTRTGESAGPTAWQETIATDLTATFLTVRRFLPGMVTRGHGAIVMLPTVAVFARHVAVDVAEYGVRVTLLDLALALDERGHQLMTTEPWSRLGRDREP
jgi:3-oxoacyl-[acyl-carrier protein] reductase